jgi:NADH:ubiquinone oxidoreductase subunit H
MLASLLMFIPVAEIPQDPAWAPGTFGGNLHVTLDSWTERSVNGNILVKFFFAGPIFGLRVLMSLWGMWSIAIPYTKNVSIPDTIQDFFNMQYYAIPNDLLWFNKTEFCIYFVDFAALCWAVMLLTLRWEASPVLIYVWIKMMSTLSPFTSMTPWDRWVMWPLGLALAFFEFALFFFVYNRGVNGVYWPYNTVYTHWGPHYQYRRPSGNRRVVTFWSKVLYLPIKLYFLRGWTCRNDYDAVMRLAYKHTPTTASLTPDLSFLSTFTESDTVVNLRYGVLFLLALSSLSVYSIVLAGWASNSKYAFIGALRSAAQMISYEVAISLILMPVILLSGSLNLLMITYVQDITVWFLFPLLPVSALFLVAMLAETNRTPFDLPEAEAELVAGYNVDYSSLPFAMFFLGEYCNMILIATLYCLLFLSGGFGTFAAFSSVTLALKAALIWVFFVIVRATLPRYRYDQLMELGWKGFLPLAGGFLILVFGILVAVNALPVTTELPLNPWKMSFGVPLLDS